MATNGSQTTTVEAQINYFPPDGPKIFYPGTAGYQRRKFDTRTVRVKDVRESKEELTLDKNGFQLAQNKWTPLNHDDDEAKTRELVYKETESFLKRVTGCSRVVSFSHLVRFNTAEDVKNSAEGLKDEDSLKAAGPTRFAHCDNSPTGALTVLRDGLKDEAESQRLSKSRWAIVNTWRGLRPVTRDPLAMLDSRTVPDDELVGVFSAFPKYGTKGAFGNAYEAGEGFETSQVKAGDTHQWYYVSDLQPDEALVFKQHDSWTGEAYAPLGDIDTNGSWANKTEHRG